MVDNGSTDSSLAAIADKPVQVLSNPINRGFGAACNQGAENLADEQWVVFVNPDCEVEPNCLEIMSQAISEHSGVGMAGAWVMNTDGSVQSATRRHLPTVRRTLRSLFRRPSGSLRDRRPVSSNSAEVEAVSGALMMLSSECFRSLGGFDEAYFLHCEDLDLMRRASQADWTIRLCYNAKAVHAKGISHSTAPLRANFHKHVSFTRYFWPTLKWIPRLGWTALIWVHFVVRVPVWWLSSLGRR